MNPGREVPFHTVQYSENISRALEIVFVAGGRAVAGLQDILPASRRRTAEPAAQAAQFQLDNVNDTKEPRRALGADVMENQFYRVSVDRATGRVGRKLFWTL